MADDEESNYSPSGALLPPEVAVDTHDYEMFPAPASVVQAESMVCEWYEEHRHLVAHAIAVQKQHHFFDPMSPSQMQLIKDTARRNYAVAKYKAKNSTHTGPLMSVYDMFPLPEYTASALAILREWRQDKSNLKLHALAIQKQFDIVSPMSIAQRDFVKKCSETNYANVQLAFSNSQDFYSNDNK